MREPLTDSILQTLIWDAGHISEIPCLVAEIRRLRTIIKNLMTNPHLDLEDRIYSVRDSEGLGWDGPAVKAWGTAVRAAEAAMKEWE